MLCKVYLVIFVKTIKLLNMKKLITILMLLVAFNVSSQKTGIYYISELDSAEVRILPSVFSGTKTNTLGAAFSYGIASSKIKSTMNRPSSVNVVKNTKPVFIFYFARNNNNFAIGASNWWFATASSPNEFVLVKLVQKKKTREMVTGKVNLYSGVNIGVDQKYIVDFDIETIDDFTYKVYPKIDFEPGEYCFYYQGTIPQGGYTNQSVFDFSIQ